MECSLSALVLCFSWSNLYLDSTTDFIHDREPRFTESYYGETLRIMREDGSESFLQRNMVREINRNEREIFSLYGRASLGYELDMRTLRIDVSAFYQESLAIADRGEIGASLKVRWFPFRR